ncbi:dynein light chain roadblock-type 2-like [Teleopsis dalmanni]|uniref:dynein light chain roadblock-type 2-like n=1 Tax=Teleopsis dalmanni TaxID=139649 RepID=UPI0018CC9C25|nr:dynein light chain roadblock-type 2-like [Teleopsis dalmanni]XP_037955380.1 dynein light chain roadblock-type 2-like [Teleopsis dalmanni]
MEKITDPNKRTRRYVEEAYEQIMKRPDIVDVLILNKIGNPVKTTMEEEIAIQCAGLYELLRLRAHYIVHKLDQEDELLMVRLRTGGTEVIICPDGNITCIVVQRPVDRMQT